MHKKRILYLDIIKVFSALLVVFNHMYWYILPNGRMYTLLRFFLFSFSKSAVPLFIMVTGALILRKDISYSEMFKKRIVRMIFALVVVSVFYTIYCNSNLLYVIPKIFEGNSTGENNGFIPYWSWYIYLLIGLYIMTPFIKKMIERFSDKDYKVFIGLFVVFISILNCLPTFTSVFIGTSWGFNGNFTSTLFSIGVGYYVFGYYASKKTFSKRENIICLIGFWVSIIFSTLYLYYFSRKMNDPNNFPLEYSYFPISIAAMCLFINFKYYFEKGIENELLKKLIVISSASGFGIYLFHVPLIETLYKTKFMSKIFLYNSLLGTFVLLIVVFVLLDLLFYILRKIPIIRKIF